MTPAATGLTQKGETARVPGSRPMPMRALENIERQIQRQLRFMELKRGAIGRRIGWRMRAFEQKNLNRDEFRFIRHRPVGDRPHQRLFERAVHEQDQDRARDHGGGAAYQIHDAGAKNCRPWTTEATMDSSDSARQPTAIAR